MLKHFFTMAVVATLTPVKCVPDRYRKHYVTPQNVVGVFDSVPKQQLNELYIYTDSLSDKFVSLKMNVKNEKQADSLFEIYSKNPIFD